MSTPSGKVKAVVTRSCPTLCNPVDCSPPGSSVHGILQARILEWSTIPFSRGSSQPRDQTCVSGIAGEFFTLPPNLRSDLKSASRCSVGYFTEHNTFIIFPVEGSVQAAIRVGSGFTLLMSRSQGPASCLTSHHSILLPDMGFVCDLERILSVSVQSGDRNYMII